MREILFRGRDKYTNEWFYGFVEAPHTTVDGVVESYYFNSYVNGKSCRKIISADTLGQYTGLTDKNGMKIFEGDIVDVAYDIDYVGISAERIGAFIVVFENGCFMKRNEKGLFHFIPSDKCKVIGNIHDNSELLKEAEQE